MESRPELPIDAAHALNDRLNNNLFTGLIKTASEKANAGLILDGIGCLDIAQQKLSTAIQSSVAPAILIGFYHILRTANQSAFELAKATEYILKILLLDPENKDALDNLKVICEYLPPIEQADLMLEALKKMPKCTPTTPEYISLYINLGNAFIAHVKNFKRTKKESISELLAPIEYAESLFALVLRFNPNNQEAIKGLYILKKEANTLDADPTLKEIYKQSCKSAFLQNKISTLALYNSAAEEEQNISAAAKIIHDAYEKASEEKPDWAQIISQLSSIPIKLDIDTRGLLGRAYYHTNNYENAFANFEDETKFPEQDPITYLNHFYRAFTNFKLNNRKQAKKDCIAGMMVESSHDILTNEERLKIARILVSNDSKKTKTVKQQTDIQRINAELKKDPLNHENYYRITEHYRKQLIDLIQTKSPITQIVKCSENILNSIITAIWLYQTSKDISQSCTLANYYQQLCHTYATLEDFNQCENIHTQTLQATKYLSSTKRCESLRHYNKEYATRICVLAEIFIKKNQFDDARKCYQSAHKYYPIEPIGIKGIASLDNKLAIIAKSKAEDESKAKRKIQMDLIKKQSDDAEKKAAHEATLIQQISKVKKQLYTQQQKDMQAQEERAATEKAQADKIKTGDAAANAKLRKAVTIKSIKAQKNAQRKIDKVNKENAKIIRAPFRVTFQDAKRIADILKKIKAATPLNRQPIAYIFGGAVLALYQAVKAKTEDRAIEESSIIEVEISVKDFDITHNLTFEDLNKALDNSLVQNEKYFDLAKAKTANESEVPIDYSFNTIFSDETISLNKRLNLDAEENGEYTANVLLAELMDDGTFSIISRLEGREFQDIDQHILDTVKKPEESFADDEHRLLRGFKTAASAKLTPSARLAEAQRNFTGFTKSPKIAGHINAWMVNILSDQHTGLIFDALNEKGVFQKLFPEVAKTILNKPAGRKYFELLVKWQNAYIGKSSPNIFYAHLLIIALSLHSSEKLNWPKIHGMVNRNILFKENYNIEKNSDAYLNKMIIEAIKRRETIEFLELREINLKNTSQARELIYAIVARSSIENFDMLLKLGLIAKWMPEIYAAYNKKPADTHDFKLQFINKYFLKKSKYSEPLEDNLRPFLVNLRLQSLFRTENAYACYNELIALGIEEKLFPSIAQQLIMHRALLLNYMKSFDDRGSPGSINLIYARMLIIATSLQSDGTPIANINMAAIIKLKNQIPFFETNYTAYDDQQFMRLINQNWNEFNRLLTPSPTSEIQSPLSAQSSLCSVLSGSPVTSQSSGFSSPASSTQSTPRTFAASPPPNAMAPALAHSAAATAIAYAMPSFALNAHGLVARRFHTKMKDHSSLEQKETPANVIPFRDKQF